MSSKKIFLIFLFLLFFVPQSFVFAIATRISPVRIDRLVYPGQVLEEKITIANLSDSPTTYYFYLADFRASGEMGEAELVAPGTEKEYSLVSWIKITGEPIQLGPKEEKEISFQIKIPDNASPGGYYGAIIAATAPPQVRGEGRERGAIIGVAQQTACLVLLQIAGPVEENAMVREFSTDKDFYFQIPLEVKFISRIQNLGNVHIKPSGIIEIKNYFGKTIETIPVNQDGANVLPKTIRRFENSWKRDIGFGKYTASLALTYGTPPDRGGQGIKSLYAQTSFWILPLKIVLPIAVGILIFVTLFVLFLRFYKQLAIKSALEEAGIPPSLRARGRKKPALPLIFTFILILLAILIIFALIYLLFLI
jgi:hypothetical protein